MDLYCVASAIMFVVGNVLNAIELTKFRNRAYFDFERFKQFDTGYIQTEWNYRLSQSRTVGFVGGLLNALAWIVFAIPILQVTWLQSLKGRRLVGLHVTVAVLAITGATIELLSRLLIIGSMDAQRWMARDFNLDNWTNSGVNDFRGWQVLELVHIATQGMTLWVDAVEWLFLAVIFFCLALSVILTSGSSIFSMRWAGLTAFLSILAILDFVAAILRYYSWRTFAGLSVFLSVTNQVVLFPMWLIWMGMFLSKAKMELRAADSSELKSLGGSAKPNDVGPTDSNDDAVI